MPKEQVLSGLFLEEKATLHSSQKVDVNSGTALVFALPANLGHAGHSFRRNEKKIAQGKRSAALGRWRRKNSSPGGATRLFSKFASRSFDPPGLADPRQQIERY
jgi:hypothetical protein